MNDFTVYDKGLESGRDHRYGPCLTAGRFYKDLVPILDASFPGQLTAYLDEKARLHFHQPGLPSRHDTGLPMLTDSHGGAHDGK